MNCIPNSVCVCVLLWIEIAASAGRENDKVGELLKDQQTAAREWEKGSGNKKKVESEV